MISWAHSKLKLITLVLLCFDKITQNVLIFINHVFFFFFFNIAHSKEKSIKLAVGGFIFKSVVYLLPQMN